MPNWQASPYLVALIVTAAVSFMLSLYCWGRRNDRTGAYFALLMLVVAEWAFTQAMERSIPDASVKILLSKFQYVGIVSVAPLWLFFAMSYGKMEESMTRIQRVLVWVFPGIILALAATNELHGLVWPRITPDSPFPDAQLIYGHGPAVWANAVFAYTTVAIATVVIVRTAARAPKVFRRQGLILVIGAAIPWAGNILYMSGASPFHGLDLTPTAFMISGLLVTWSIFRFRFLALIPIAHETLFTGMTDGVVALDAESRVIDINDAAMRIAGIVKDPVGRKAVEAFAAWPQFLERFRGVSEIQAEISIGSEDHPAWIDVRIFPVISRQGRRHGRLIVLRDITSRKLAEDALRESEERFRLLVENAPDAIFVQIGGLFAFVNPAACRLFGARSPGELLGTPISDRFREDVPGSVRAGFERLDPKRDENPKSEETCLRLDGAPGEAEVAAVPIVYEKKAGTLVFIRDISERKRAEEALRKSEATARLFLNSTHDIALMTDAEGRILDFNDAFVNVVGKEPAVLRGADAFAILPPTTDQTRKEFVLEEVIGLGRPLAFEDVRDTRCYDTRIYPVFGPDGRAEKAIMFSADITERKKAVEKLKASIEEKNVLLKEVHHRVKNNMQVISSMLNLQSREVRDARVLDMFRDTQNRIRSMALVHEKLYQSRDLSQVDFASYLQTLIIHLFHSHQQDTERIRYESNVEEISLGINTAIPLGLIVSELLSNALKYAFPGDHKGMIRISLRPDRNSWLCLTVADDGIGLPGDLDLRSVASLGLQIVNMLVEQLDGVCDVDRKNGTEFRIRFQELRQRPPL
ncbi:MAG: histidine kinase N-terminal 7TM domain-containing protein [Candidatus Aminicenantales bacterium]